MDEERTVWFRRLLGIKEVLMNPPGKITVGQGHCC